MFPTRQHNNEQCHSATTTTQKYLAVFEMKWLRKDKVQFIIIYRPYFVKGDNPQNISFTAEAKVAPFYI
jgi:hypothetical protein